MNQVAANVFRQGYSTRTFRGMDIFRHREDNVQRSIKQIEHSVSAHDVVFNLRFNINEVEFVSRLNENMMDAMRKSSFYQELVEVITRDYQVSKR